MERITRYRKRLLENIAKDSTNGSYQAESQARMDDFRIKDENESNSNPAFAYDNNNIGNDDGKNKKNGNTSTHFSDDLHVNFNKDTDSPKNEARIHETSDNNSIVLRPNEQFNNLTHYYNNSKKSGSITPRKIIRAFNKEHYRISKNVMTLSERIKNFIPYHVRGHIDTPGIVECYERRYNELSKHIVNNNIKLQNVMNSRNSVYEKKELLLDKVGEEHNSYNLNLASEKEGNENIKSLEMTLSSYERFSPKWIDAAKRLSSIQKETGKYRLQKTNAKVKRDGYDMQIKVNKEYIKLIDTVLENQIVTIAEAVNLLEAGRDLNKSILTLPEAIKEKESLKGYAMGILKDLYSCSKIMNEMARLESGENNRITDRYL